MLRWLEDPSNGIPDDGKRRSSARGNLSKEILRDDVSWKVFIKGLKFLNPMAISITFEMKWTKEYSTFHVVNIPIKDLTPDNEPYDLPPSADGE